MTAARFHLCKCGNEKGAFFIVIRKIQIFILIRKIPIFIRTLFMNAARFHLRKTRKWKR